LYIGRGGHRGEDERRRQRYTTPQRKRGRQRGRHGADKRQKGRQMEKHRGIERETKKEETEGQTQREKGRLRR
jgi:hypothetical protein